MQFLLCDTEIKNTVKPENWLLTEYSTILMLTRDKEYSTCHLHLIKYNEAKFTRRIGINMYFSGKNCKVEALVWIHIPVHGKTKESAYHK